MSDAGSPVASPGSLGDSKPDTDVKQADDQQLPQEEDGISDKESDLLSEIDEDQFDDYEEQPVNIDEDVAKTLKPSKRKRADGETNKKPKEGRRSKRPRSDEDDDDLDSPQADFGERQPRKIRLDSKKRLSRKASPQPEEKDENLTPEERRRRALDRAMDAALKNPTKRRRKKDEVVS